MSNRKPNFYSFLLPVVLVSFAPLLAHADGSPHMSAVAAICSPPANAPDSFKQRFAQADPSQQQAWCAKWADEKKGQDVALGEKPMTGAPHDMHDAHAAPAPASVPADSSQNIVLPEVPISTAPMHAPAPASVPNNSSAPIQAPVSPSDNNNGPAPQAMTPASALGNIPSGPHYLSSDEVSHVFDNMLQIATYPLGTRGDGSTTDKPTSASLAGLVPNDCLPLMQVSTTSWDKTLKVPAGTVGFAIYDKGGFGACMDEHRSACDNDVSGKLCTPLSQVEGGKIHFDASTSGVHVAYLDFMKPQDPALGQSSWAAKDIKGSMQIESDAQIASEKQAAQDARDKALEKDISSCISQGDLPIAQEHLNEIMDPAIRTALTDKIGKEQVVLDQKAGDKALADLDKAIDDAATNDDQLKAAAGVEQKIKDFAQKYPDRADVAAERMRILAQNLAGGEEGVSLANTPSDAMLKNAKRLMKESMADDSGIAMSDDEKKKLKFFESTELAKRDVQASFARSFNLGIAAMSGQEQDPLKLMRAQEQAVNESKKATKLQESTLKSLESQLKKMGCVDKNGLDTKKSTENDDLGNSCNVVKEDIRDVQYANQALQQQANTELQKMQQQQAQQMQQAMAQQRAAMGLPAQQQSVLPANTTFGPGLNGGAPGAMGGGQAMSIPAYNGGYMMTQPMSMNPGMMGMPVSYGYNPYSFQGSFVGATMPMMGQGAHL